MSLDKRYGLAVKSTCAIMKTSVRFPAPVLQSGKHP